jgi:membrane protein YqaA with SNARE-associated domain
MVQMKIFSYLYEKTLKWAGHKNAPFYLAGVSFAESSFFPIPPDVMLISMGLALPRRSWYYALITTLFSVMGGVFGYLIGFYFMETIGPWIEASSFSHAYHTVEHWFQIHGIVLMFVAAFSPIPYKLFTIAAGAMDMPLLPFILISFIGRGTRFFLVSALMYFMGDSLQNRLRKYVEIIGWSFLAILVVVFLLIKFLS